MSAVATPPRSRSKATTAAKPAQEAFPSAALRRRATLLRHLGEPTRLQVLATLAEGEQNVGQLCEILGSSQPAVSHHLALLRHAGLIEARRAGKNNFYGLTDIGRMLAEAAMTIEV